MPARQTKTNGSQRSNCGTFAAAEGKLGDEMGTVRQIIKMLTGGRIDLFQQGERKAYQGWLEGRCRVRLLQYLVSAVFCRSRFLSSSPQNVEKLPKKTRGATTTPHLAVEYRGFPDTMCGSFLMFAVHLRSIIGWLAQDY